MRDRPKRNGDFKSPLLGNFAMRWEAHMYFATRSQPPCETTARQGSSRSTFRYGLGVVSIGVALGLGNGVLLPGEIFGIGVIPTVRASPLFGSAPGVRAVGPPGFKFDWRTEGLVSGLRGAF